MLPLFGLGCLGTLLLFRLLAIGRSAHLDNPPSRPATFLVRFELVVGAPSILPGLALLELPRLPACSWLQAQRSVQLFVVGCMLVAFVLGWCAFEV